MKLKIIIGLMVLVVLVGLVLTWTSGPILNSNPTPVATTTPITPETMTIKVFFGNHRNDPQSLYCERAYPALREVTKTVASARAALTELLAGPTETERAQGFFTALNSGVALQSLMIKDGVATVDFSSRLGEGVGGSCLVTAIRAQIGETLKQFSTVDSVVIAINGRSEDVLQP
jgi:spore germination protein GerM